MDRADDGVAVIEHQITLFLRRVESARRLGTLDRSAYLLLGELEVRGPVGVNVLAQTFALDISTASRQTSALEAKGLVERLTDDRDARVSLLRITPLGREQFEATRIARRTRFAELLEDWSPEDRERFGQYLERFNQSLGEKGRPSEG